MSTVKKETVKAREEYDYPIIYRPEGRSKWVRFLEYVIIFLGTALVWYFFVRHMVFTLLGSAYSMTKEVFFFLALVAIVELIAIVGWGYYNKWRYGDLNRRKGFPMLSDDKFAKIYGLTEADLQKLREMKDVDVVGLGEGLAWRIDGKEIMFTETKHIKWNVPERDKF